MRNHGNGTLGTGFAETGTAAPRHAADLAAAWAGSGGRFSVALLCHGAHSSGGHRRGKRQTAHGGRGGRRNLYHRLQRRAV